MFGFAVVSVKCPQSLFDQYQADGFLFPPIVRQMTVKMEMLSPYMREKYEVEGTSCEEPTLCQTYSGEDLLLYTPLIRFYMEKGYMFIIVSSLCNTCQVEYLHPLLKKVSLAIYHMQH